MFGIYALFSSDMAIDLGTANTLVYVKGRGIVVNEPSIVAFRTEPRREVIAVGHEAKIMLGRTPGKMQTIRPLKDGVIADFEVAEEMIKAFIRKAHRRAAFAPPLVIICVPSGATPVERRAIKDSALRAGARRVYLIEEPIAAALGAGLPIEDPTASMVVDIGGGTTEVAVFAMGGIVVSRSIRVAGDEMDEDIIQYARNKYNLLIGDRMAERVKIGIGSAFPLPEERTMTLRGRNLINGLPQAVEISSIELREAMSPSINIIVDTVRDCLDDTPPELVADLMEVGICLAGGGAQIRGLADRLEDMVKMRVWVAEDAMTCVARGAGRVLENIELWRRSLTGLHRGSTHH